MSDVLEYTPHGPAEEEIIFLQLSAHLKVRYEGMAYIVHGNDLDIQLGSLGLVADLR
jgi:hypothetical protein